MKRMTVMIAAVCCTGAAAAALTSRSYVQDGLIAQYDGINNAGHGVAHSNSTNVWKDLAGSFDLTRETGGTWGGNCLVASGSALAAKRSASAPTYKTIEVVYKWTASAASVLFAGGDKLRTVFFKVSSDASVPRGVFFSGSHASAAGYPTSTKYFTSPYDSVVCAAARYGNASDTGEVTDILLDGELQESEKKTGSYWSHNTDITTIGGRRSGSSDSGFWEGDIYAIRLYSTVLSDDDIARNAAIDAVRFKGGDPADYPILANYTFDEAGVLCAEFSATASAGGKVGVGGGASAASASAPVSALMSATFTAVPDAGYVFQEWTGDISAITSGSLITPTITVKSASGGAVQAVFRKRGTALDGMVFDLDVQDLNGNGAIEAGDKIGNAMKVSASDAANAYTKAWSTTDNATFSAYSPKFSTLNVAGPMTPFTTNSQTCLVFPQHVEGDTCFNSRVELTKCGIMGEVATFFVRFKWDGAATDAANCNIALLLNGCTGGYYNNKKGFGLILRTKSGNADEGWLDVVGNGQRGQGTDTSKFANSLKIVPGSWIDCFMSVYPSPTDADKSNADIYFCTNALNVASGKFCEPQLNHFRFGDSAALGKFTAIASTSQAMWFGSERNDVYAGAAYRSTAFRGAIAAVKGWRRLLTEDEMWCVMAGLHGGIFHAGVPDGKADEFGASGTEETFDPSSMPWQKMKRSLDSSDRTLTLSVPLPEANRKLARLFVIKPLFDGVGATCPVSVTANGVDVGTFDLMNEAERTILLRGGAAACNADGRLVISIVRPEGCAGTLSFDALSLTGSWQIGTKNGSKAEMKEEGKGVPQVAIMGDPIYKHVQRSLTKVCPSLSLFFDVPENVGERCTWIYSTKFLDPQAGHAQPIHIEVNGATVWQSANVENGTEVDKKIDASLLVPGLNELKLCYDTTEPNWISIDWHRLKLVPPPLGLFVVIH